MNEIVPVPSPSVQWSSNKPVRNSRSWILRRICSQNPFYLLSVCFVLHGTARWFHTETGAAFSPWPLLGLIAGYTILLAATGFVIVKFGHVWDDARSILLIILLMFVELSLIFDENLARDPATGRMLLLTCWAFAIVLSEALLIGLRIHLPFWFRLPYHLLLALQFLYPFSLVSWGTALTNETVLWRIFLFPVVAASILLFLIPAIRRGSRYTKDNGTPWVWPLYPWSIFIFLTVCIGFRAYALSLSFDPVLGESLASALRYSSAFGMYFLVPIVFAIGLLLLEIGIVENRPGIIEFSFLVPMICFYMSVPAEYASVPYTSFLRLVIDRIGSPIWLTTIGGVAFYGLAFVRRVQFAEPLLAFVLLVMTRVGPKTIDESTIPSIQWWPLLLFGLFELSLGLARKESRRVFIASLAFLAVMHVFMDSVRIFTITERTAISAMLGIACLLLIGAMFRDDFAWFLRLIGAPLLVAMTLVGCAVIRQQGILIPTWGGPIFVAAMTAVSLGYAVIMGISLYRLAGVFCAAGGSLCLVEMVTTYLIRQSGWIGAPSYVAGIACFAIAFAISSCKAGWLKGTMAWMRRMAVVPAANSA